MLIEEAVKDTLKHVTIRGAAPGTIEWYSMGLRLFAGYLRERSILRVDEIDFRVLQDYVDHTRTRPRLDGKPGRMSVSTINTHIKTMRGCFKYLHRVGAVGENPAKNICYLRKEYSITRSFSADQIRALVSVIPDNTFAGRRNRLLVLVLVDCGLRISEALGIRAEDVFFDQKLFKVAGKGGRERLVPFGNRVKEELRGWISTQSLKESDRIFFGRRRDGITTSAVRGFFREHGRKAGLKGVRVSPHTFRHTFAIMFLRNGGNPFVLQRILGHSTLEMTQRYVNLLVEDLQREHASFGPGDRLGI